MKKHLLFYLLFVLLAMNARAQQNTTVTIGTGTAASADHGPIFANNVAGGHFSQHAAIYLASEINATSFTAKVLTKIAWNKTDSSRYNKNNGVLKIYIKPTTASTISTTFQGDVLMSTELAGATLVYSSTTQNISAGAGWKTFDLQAPFIWNGTSNLEVIVDWTEPGVSTGNIAIEWATTPVTTDISAFYADAFQPGYIYLTPNRPNAQLTFTEYSNDAGISAITSPAATIAPGALPVQVTVKNFGNNALTTAAVGWKVNGIAQPDFAWTGNLPTGQTAAASTLGNYTFPFGSSTIKAYTKNPNGVNDPLKINDTTTFKVLACNTLSGNYTINKNAPASATNLRSFTEAAQVLNTCGVNGAVTFTVVPGSGPYNEAFELKNVVGASAANTITFEGNGNTITAELTTTRPATIKINNAPYVKINNLVVNTTSTTIFTGYGIQFLNQSHYGTVSNCTINMPLINSASDLVGLVIGVTHNGAGDNSNNSLFENNTVYGGYYGMRINGKAPVAPATNPTGAINVQVINNQFKDFFATGIYLSNADGTTIERNSFSRPTRTDAGSFLGVSLTANCRRSIINKNRFFNTHGAATSKTSGVTGIEVQIAAPVGFENIIKNNLFYDLNNAANITVLNTYSSTTEGVYFYHNTISLNYAGRPATNTSVIKAFNLAGPGANVRFVNNIVTINTPGTGIKAAMYFAGATAINFVSNNNVFYIAPGQTSAYVGYVAAPAPVKTAATLAAWQAVYLAIPYDLNSVEVNPGFINLATGNLKPTAPLANNSGQGLPAVIDDILGVTRNASTPDAGAYEFDLGSDDAGITAIVSPTTPATPGTSVPVTVTLKNMGTANLSTATIGWKVNNVVQPSFAWTGNVATNQTAAVTIGNFTFAAGTHTVCAWTKNPNAATDTNPANDSTCTVINACLPMAGNYTIDKNSPASVTNFPSFTAAAQRLHNCGVSAKVTITVAPSTGPYTEQVDLLSIPGVSAVNRVILQGNGNTLTAAPSAQKANVLVLNNADFVKINNLTVALTGTPIFSAPSSAIQLINNSDNDTISNCTIDMPLTIGSNLYVTGIYAGAPQTISGNINLNSPGNYTNNSVFMNNAINGGNTGIVINGNTGGTDAVNNRITGNVIQNGFHAGISLMNVDGNLVELNEIKRPTYTNAGAFHGITLDAFSLGGESKNTKIRKNRIHHLWASQPSATNLYSYGIYCSGTGVPAGSENVVSNNLFYDTNSTKAWGIYNAASGIYYYHNTLDITNTGDAVGFYQNTAVTNVRFENNIVTINASGSGVKFAIELTNPGAIVANNNAYFIDPGNINIALGKLGNISFPTLNTWQAAAIQDQQSVYLKPVYTNVATGDFTPKNPYLNNTGKPLPAVPTDITGAVRSTTTPDAGAYEFTPVANDAGVIAIITPNSGCSLTSQETVTIKIANFGTATQTAVPVSFQVDAGPVVTETFTGTLALGDSATYTFTAKANLSVVGPHTILAKTILPNDAVAANDGKTVTTVNTTPASLPVTYNFETAATGVAALRTIIRVNSAIVESTAASTGVGSTKGMIMDGVANANWVSPTGAINPWTTNPGNFAGAYLCLSTTNTNPADTLRLTFDLKQLFKVTNANTNFRVTVNGVQVGSTYRPPFAGGTPVWQKVTVKLYGASLTQSTLQIGLESSVNEAYANGNGNANLIDNITVTRVLGPNGVKDNVLAKQLSVYPNPSNGLFNVNLPQGKNYALEVTDLTGKVIHRQEAKGETQLKLENITKGIYLLKVSGENGMAVRKLIVE